MIPPHRPVRRDVSAQTPMTDFGGGVTEQLAAVTYMLRPLSNPRSAIDTLLDTITTFAAAKAILLILAVSFGARVAVPGAPLGERGYLFLFFGFATDGLWLITFGHAQEKARHLGTVFLIVSAAFCREAAREISAEVTRSFSAGIGSVLLINLDPLLPLYMWLFAADWLSGCTVEQAWRISRTAGLWLSSALAITLLAIDIGNHLFRGSAPNPAWIVSGQGNVYWVLIFALMTTALGFLSGRIRHFQGKDRARASWILASLALGLSPVALEVMAESVSPRFREWAHQPSVYGALGCVISLALLTIPIGTGYAVLKKHALDVRVVLRRGLQCALAKYAFMLIAIAPLTALVFSMRANGNVTVHTWMAAGATQRWFFTSAVGLACLASAQRILRKVDAVFFRPRYDARPMLDRAKVSFARAIDSVAVIAELNRCLSEAFEPRRASILIRSRSGTYDEIDGHASLDSQSSLVDLFASGSVHSLAVTDRVLRVVSAKDAAWLVATAADIIVAIRSFVRPIVGLIAIADRLDGRPYYDEDRRFLEDLTAAAATCLPDPERCPSGGAVNPTSIKRTAAECTLCGFVSEPVPNRSYCERCSSPLHRSDIPRIINGKFRVKARIGIGGMGRVYLAEDLLLRRLVAVKTLSYISPRAEERLLSEGRTMSAASHPNLATIYGYEVCERRPLLIVEYLDGGTLGDRLNGMCLAIREVIELGLSICDALSYLHGLGSLHGDIKPANIGFTGSGRVKLLDFGLAEKVGESAGDAAPRIRWGTPAYRCPDVEVVSDAVPQFDLWSLAAVLYEAIAGEKVSNQSTKRRHHPILDLRELREDVPPELSHFFRRALHSNIEVRPATAQEFSLWLSQAFPVD